MILIQSFAVFEELCCTSFFHPDYLVIHRREILLSLFSEKETAVSVDPVFDHIKKLKGSRAGTHDPPRGNRGKESPCQCRKCKETQVRSLGWEDPLEEGLATHPRILT